MCWQNLKIVISVTGTVCIIKPVFRSQMTNIKTITLHVSCYNNNSLAYEKTIQLMAVVMDFSGCSIHHAFWKVTILYMLLVTWLMSAQTLYRHSSARRAEMHAMMMCSHIWFIPTQNCQLSEFKHVLLVCMLNRVSTGAWCCGSHNLIADIQNT